jgi:hypothetical protein
LSPLLFNIALLYQKGLKLNGTYQLLVYVDDVNLLGGNVMFMEKDKTIISDSKEAGLKESHRTPSICCCVGSECRKIVT